MNPARFLPVLALALAISAVSALSGERSPEERALIADMGRASRLLEDGDAEAAYALYGELLERHPDHNILLRGRARAAAALGLDDEAAAGHRRLAEKLPDNPMVLAEARAAVEKAGGTPPAEYFREPETLDLSVARPYDPALAPPLPAGPPGETALTRFGGSARFGVMYDSNANAGPASDRLNLGDFRDVTVGGAKRIPSAAAYLGVNFDFTRRLAHDSPWAFVADAGLYVRGYANRKMHDNRSREMQTGRLAAGIQYSSGKNFLQLRLVGGVFDYEFTNAVWSLGPEITYLRALSDRFQLITQASGNIRDHERNRDKNGFYWQAGESLRMFFGPDGRHSLTVGGRYMTGDPDPDRYRYATWEAYARMTLRLTDRLDVTPSLSYSRARYRGPATVFEHKDRRDKTFSAGVDVGFALNRATRLEASYHYTKNRSNSALSRYDQHVVSAGLNWGF